MSRFTKSNRKAAAESTAPALRPVTRADLGLVVHPTSS